MGSGNSKMRWIGVALAGLVASAGCSAEDGGGPEAGAGGTMAPATGGTGAIVPPMAGGVAPMAPVAGANAPVGGAGGSATPTDPAATPTDPADPMEDPGGLPMTEPPVNDPVMPMDDPAVTPMGEDHCLSGITSFDSDGPFSFNSDAMGDVKLWVPDVPAGCQVPVIHLANGTGGSCGTYRPIHERFASHGFLATCYEDPNTGAGDQGLMALKTAVSMYPDLADLRFGSTGHSQGGQAAFTVLQLAEAEWGDEAIYAGLAMEPASGFGDQPSGGSWQQIYGMIRSPMFMFSGTSDFLVSQGWVSRGYDALGADVEAYHWSASGATHIPVPNSETQEVGVPWFRWKLLGDQEACKAFKALRDTSAWNEVEAQNEAPCQ